MHVCCSHGLLAHVPCLVCACCSLAHSLVAQLPVSQVVTTNYDVLYELAIPAVGKTLSVLPFAPLPDADRWLLKMHGCITRPDTIVLTRKDYIR